MTLMKTLTPLLDFLLTILACLSLSMTAFRLQKQLNLDLAKIHCWADKWLVTFNPGKSESIVGSRIHNKPYYPPVLLNQTHIAEVNSHKHLGITLK